MSTTALSFLRIVFCVIIGLIGGFMLAVQLIRTELQVDYDSARCRQVVVVGPFRVREATCHRDYLGSIRMGNGSEALKGVPDWRTAFRFAGNSKASRLYEAGDVLDSIAKLQGLPWSMQPSRLPQVKREFLEALSKGGPTAAGAVADAAANALLDDFNSKSRQNQ